MNTDLTALDIAGADAATFLHGQFTTDVTGLADGQAGLSAWCDPKGRALFTFILARRDEAFLLLLPADMRETFSKRLSMYRLRADVTIAAADAQAIPPIPYLSATDATTLIRQGIPLLHPPTSGRFLPQELNLDDLHALSFSKGCYPGQEIIARLRYRGAVKRRLCHAITDNSTLLTPGAALLPAGEDRHIGTVINSAITGINQELLVVLERPFIESGRVLVDGFPDRAVNSVKVSFQDDSFSGFLHTQE